MVHGALRVTAPVHAGLHEAPLHVIVHQTHRLHEGVNGRRSDERPPRRLRSFESARDSGVVLMAINAVLVMRRGREAASGCQVQK